MTGLVYVLQSVKDKRTYVGSTSDLERRLLQHGQGLVRSTRNRRPLRLIYKEELSSLFEARVKEKYYKSCSGRKKLAIILASVMPPW